MCGLLAVGTMPKRQSYDVSFKLKAIECAEKSKQAAARVMGVDSKRIRN